MAKTTKNKTTTSATSKVQQGRKASVARSTCKSVAGCALSQRATSKKSNGTSGTGPGASSQKSKR
ncbi:MAG: hypothetical protein FWC10_02140 [Lentimicrobiaceae bacterium]|nr:hypothetical protein [Lentimicrobiaceae bacterium]